MQLPTYYREIQKEPWREVIAFVESQRQPGDMVVMLLDYAAPAPQEPFDWYRTVPEAELPWQFFPEEDLLRDAAQLDELPALTRGHPRVWFLLYSGHLDRTADITAGLERHFHLLQEHHFLEFEVLLAEPASPGPGS